MTSATFHLDWRLTGEPPHTTKTYKLKQEIRPTQPASWKGVQNDFTQQADYKEGNPPPLEESCLMILLISLKKKKKKMMIFSFAENTLVPNFIVAL
jgi:hypothetical protein